MLTALALFAVGSMAQTMELAPTDDIWVYPHASDPQKDGYLRVWGVDGKSVANDPAQADEYSYSYLRFDLAKLAKGAKVTKATLILTHTPDPAWQASDAKSAPIEVRVLAKEFSEKSWAFAEGKNVFPAPGKDAILGTFAPSKVDAGAPVKFEIDLLKGPAKLDFSKPNLGVAVTSTLDPSAIGNRAVYKFYSKDYDKAEYRPKLVIEFE